MFMISTNDHELKKYAEFEKMWTKNEKEEQELKIRKTREKEKQNIKEKRKKVACQGSRGKEVQFVCGIQQK